MNIFSCDFGRLALIFGKMSIIDLLLIFGWVVFLDIELCERCVCVYVYIYVWFVCVYIYIYMYGFFFVFVFFLIFRPAPAAYGGSQARGLVGATAASHSNARSKPCLRPTLQLMATPDP